MTLNWVTYNKNVTSLEEILMDCERAKRLIHLSLLDKMFSAFSQDDSKYPFLSVTSSILFWFKCTWILQDERSVLYFISKCFLKGWLCVDDLFSQVWMRFDLVLLIFSLMQGSEENQLSFFDDTHIVTKEPRGPTSSLHTGPAAFYHTTESKKYTQTIPRFWHWNCIL